MKKSLFFIITILFFSNFIKGQNPIITKWNTNTNNDNSKQIKIPTIGSFTYTYQGITNPALTGNGIGNNGLTVIDFPQVGEYKVVITPQSTFKFAFGRDTDPENDRPKFLEISQWGNVIWNSDLTGMFFACTNLKITATDIPDFSAVTNMTAMFQYCQSLDTVPNMNQWDVSNVQSFVETFSDARNFNENIGNWNISNVTNMYCMFTGALLFNQDIGNWNTSNVKVMTGTFIAAENFNQNIGNWDTSNVLYMTAMFLGASYFNQDIGNWDTSKVTNMTDMFNRAVRFNQNIGNWNTSKVEYMEGMFLDAYRFNQDIGNWDTSSVTTMLQMFNYALDFNQDIGNWNTSKVKNMGLMFFITPEFNQDISRWDVSNVTTIDLMFNRATKFNQDLGKWNLKSLVGEQRLFTETAMDCVNYSLTLKGWSQNNEIPSNITIESGGRVYGDYGSEFRNLLINSKNWTFLGDSYDQNCLVIEEVQTPYITRWNSNINGDNSKQIKIGAVGSYRYSYQNVENPSIYGSGRENGQITNIDLPEAGVYDIKIFPLTPFRPVTTFLAENDRKKLIELKQWGTDIKWNTDLSGMLALAPNLKITATDIPNFSTVNNMSIMFAQSYSLNNIPNITQWDTSNVTNMVGMFLGASSFNQDLGGLKFNSIVDLNNFLNGAGLSCENYTKTLKGWATNPNTPNGRTFNAWNIRYGNLGLEYRNQLRNIKGWIISGDIYDPSCIVDLAVVNAFTSNETKFHPNPAKDFISIKNDRTESFVYQIIDSSGKIIKTGKAKTEERIDVRGLVKGNYVLWIEKENGERQSLKLIKN